MLLPHPRVAPLTGAKHPLAPLDQLLGGANFPREGARRRLGTGRQHPHETPKSRIVPRRLHSLSPLMPLAPALPRRKLLLLFCSG